MEKETLIALIVCVLLVGGVVLASASYMDEEEVDIQESQPVCGPRTCNQQCGGNCGVPRCGCS